MANHRPLLAWDRPRHRLKEILGSPSSHLEESGLNFTFKFQE